MGAATDSSSNTYWNGVANANAIDPFLLVNGTTSLTGLMASDGTTATGIGVQITGSLKWYNGDSSWDRLQRESVYGGNANESGMGFTISGLNLANTYDVYIYSGSSPTTYTIGAITLTTSSEKAAGIPPAVPVWNLGKSYQAFHRLYRSDVHLGNGRGDDRELLWRDMRYADRRACRPGTVDARIVGCRPDQPVGLRLAEAEVIWDLLI